MSYLLHLSGWGQGGGVAGSRASQDKWEPLVKKPCVLFSMSH